MQDVIHNAGLEIRRIILTYMYVTCSGRRVLFAIKNYVYVKVTLNFMIIVVEMH